MNAIASFSPTSPAPGISMRAKWRGNRQGREDKLKISGEQRDDVASPPLSPCARKRNDAARRLPLAARPTTGARVDGHGDRGPMSERARLIVDVGADRGFAVAATAGRGRLAVAGAAAGSVATDRK